MVSKWLPSSRHPGGPIGSWPEEFEAGNNLVINSALGSGWYVTPDASNGVAGDDQRILIAQLTTDGDLSSQFRTQIFPERPRQRRPCGHELRARARLLRIAHRVGGRSHRLRGRLELHPRAHVHCDRRLWQHTTATQVIVVEDTTAPELWTQQITLRNALTTFLRWQQSMTTAAGGLHRDGGNHRRGVCGNLQDPPFILGGGPVRQQQLCGAGHHRSRHHDPVLTIPEATLWSAPTDAHGGCVRLRQLSSVRRRV